MKPRRKTAFACGLLAVLPLLWWWPVFAGCLPDFMDTIAHGYPMRMAAARQIRAGTLPLWLPNVFSGTPLAANPQLTVWYPPQLIFYAWPSTFAYGFFAILHYIVGGLGMFAWVRRLTGSTAAALFAAFAFQFGSMLVSRIALLPHVLAVVWIPWMFWAAERAIHERGFLPGRGALLVAAFFAMQLLAGSPQIVFFTAIALPLVWIGRRFAVAGRTGVPRAVAETLSQGLTAAVTGVLVAGIQIVPMLDFAAGTTRSSLDVARLAEGGLNGGFVWRSLIGFTGSFIEDTDSVNAIGIGALLLVPFAFLRRRRRRSAIVLLAIGAIGFLLALGSLAPVWARIVPLYDGFHAPRRSLILWSVAGPAIAGIGAADLLARMRLRRLPRIAGPAALLLLSCGTLWMLPRIDRVWTKEDRLRPDARTVEAIGTDRFLVVDPTLRYSYDSRRFDFGRSMVANLSCLHDTMAVNGYDPLVPASYDRARNVACAATGSFYPSHGAFFTDPNSSVLEMLNVRYLVGRWDLFEPGRVIPGVSMDRERLAGRVELVVPHTRWPVYRFTDERPLAWIPQRVVSVGTEEEALFAAVSTSPRDMAFNTAGIDMTTATAPPAVGARYVDARTIEVSLEPPPSAETFVSVAVPWSSGWRIAGSESSLVLSVNGTITGLLVPGGTQSVRLVYAPASFRTGALLTLAGLVLLAAGFLADRRRLRS